MEPMTLGTPTSSGPSSPATTPTGSTYLPSFLLGETQNTSSTSPKMKRVSFSENGVRDGSRNEIKSPSYENNLFHQPIRSPSHILQHQSSNEKSSGPPIKGLFDSLNTPGLTTNAHPGTSSDAAQFIKSASERYVEQRVSPERQLEPTDTNWVTVFGYPPSSASFILTQMSHCGNVISTKSPIKGNWMHIQYSSRLDVRKALSNNGKVFAGTVMIGVIPCRDQGVIAEYRSNKENLDTSVSLHTPTTSHGRNQLYPDLSSSVLDQSSQLYESPYSPGRMLNARPLQQRTGDTEVFASGNTPQKNSGLVSKALEYVFGW